MSSPNAHQSAQQRNTELLSQARSQVDRLAPSLDLNTALLARFPWGHDASAVRRNTVALLANTRANLDRDITDREAVAMLRTTRARTSALGQAEWLSVVVAGALWYRGRKTFRFPFWTPKRPPLGGGPLTHTLRMVAYTFACEIGLAPVVSTLGTMLAAGQMKEEADTLKPLLKELTETRNMRAQHGSGPMGVPGRQQQQQPPQQQQQQQQPTYTTRWPSDDSAPPDTPQQQEQEVPASYTTRWPEDPSTQYTPATNQSSYQSQTSTPAPEASDRWGSSSPLDDASPLAASDEASPTSQQPTAGSWARLRQQARTNQQSQPQSQPQQQQQGSWDSVRQSSNTEWGAAQEREARAASGGSGRPRESYTYSSADADKETARAQEQREFDRMLENERRGEGGGGSVTGGWK